jgi:hypothetical protein
MFKKVLKKLKKSKKMNIFENIKRFGKEYEEDKGSFKRMRMKFRLKGIRSYLFFSFFLIRYESIQTLCLCSL